ncbi:TPA: hypothetical protein ACGJSI_004061, partial [Pseudomonas aeruginosa]
PIFFHLTYMTPADASAVAALFTVKRAVHAARMANKTTSACNPPYPFTYPVPSSMPMFFSP